jgi:hypothetical protein
MDKLDRDHLDTPSRKALIGLHQRMGGELFGKNCYAMPAAIELQNLGDAQLCRDIAASIEHALSDKRGEWRVSIAGSLASENWEMRVEGLNGFERRQFADRFSSWYRPAPHDALFL